MEPDIWLLILLLAAFFMAGFVDSVAGGGGLISIPALLLAGIPPEMAMGTNKPCSTIGSCISLALYARGGMVLWKSALVSLPVAVLAGALGTKMLLYFDSGTIGKLVIFLLPLGILFTMMPKRDRGEDRELTPFARYAMLPLICVPVGFYDGFLGIGSGSLYILVLHAFVGMGLVKASGTAKVFNLAGSISASLVYIWHGVTLFWLVLPLTAANIAGNWLGSKLAMRIGAPFVRRLLFLMLCFLFASLIWKFWVA